MRERIKTVILLLLIISSVLMTTSLLFGQPYLETGELPAFEQVSFGELRPLKEQILPVLRLGKAEQWLQLQPWHEGYQVAWQRLLWLCQYAQEPHKGTPPVNGDSRQLRITFTLGVDLAWWAANDSIKGLQIEEIRWYADEEQTVWLKRDSGQWLRAFLPMLPLNWETQLAELFRDGLQLRLATEDDLAGLEAVAEGVLIPQHLPKLPDYTAQIENLEREKLLRSVFVNLDLVRRIEERDGAVIYTDGLKGLRFFKQGVLEYTAPKNEPGLLPLAMEEVLRQGAQYLQLMGGWPKQLYLQTIRATQQLTGNREHWHTYEIHFQTAGKGWPLISSTPALRLYFSDQGVIYYSRQLYQLENAAGPELTLVTPKQALMTLRDNLVVPAAETKLLNLEVVFYLAATDKEQVLARPAWQIQLTNGQTAIVDGHTGQFRSWLE